MRALTLLLPCLAYVGHGYRTRMRIRGPGALHKVASRHKHGDDSGRTRLFDNRAQRIGVPLSRRSRWKENAGENRWRGVELSDDPVTVLRKFRGGARQEDSEDFYARLGVARDASDDAIKKAYKKAAVRWHPDKNLDDKDHAESMFQNVAEAYEVLSDPQKRSLYDMGGREAVKNYAGGGGADFSSAFGGMSHQQAEDLLGSLFGAGNFASFGERRLRTKDVVRPIRVSLEDLYKGKMQKMAVTRQVVDKSKGVEKCSVCGGLGAKVETIRMGPVVQQTQSPCQACKGHGKMFQMRQDRQVLEVHIQPGSPDGLIIPFREMADEYPDADTGDIIFVVQQEEHRDFRRHGADLFIERKISLVEALCGFEMEITHLDGRKLLIKTLPGDIVTPFNAGLDPSLSAGSGGSNLGWQVIENTDCPDIRTVAQADITDVDTLKKVCETQFKAKGVDVNCFVIDGNGGRAYFKQGRQQEILSAKKNRRGHTMYVVSEGSKEDSHVRTMKAVKGEGMPTYENPTEHGNLFLALTIEFPESLTPEAQQKLRKLLPPPLQKPTISEKDKNVEVHNITDLDPLQSFEQGEPSGDWTR